MKPKVIFIAGPTAVGKTNLSLVLASKLNAEIVSADSIQVFKGLDIISGKDLPPGYKLKDGLYFSKNNPSFHLLDVSGPTSKFDLSSYYKRSIKAIGQIHKRNRLPIVVGGTGLYIEVLLNGLSETAKPNFKLREKLNNLSVLELQKMLSKNDLGKLNTSDRNNKRRLVRLIEKVKSGKKNSKMHKPDYESLVLGLKCDRVVLKQRIDNRVHERIENGALKEAKGLFNNYENLAPQVRDANGYKQLFEFLKGEISYDEAIYRWKVSEYRHAKNQMTWFNKYGNVNWFDISTADYVSKVERRIKEFLL